MHGASIAYCLVPVGASDATNACAVSKKWHPNEVCVTVWFTVLIVNIVWRQKKAIYLS